MNRETFESMLLTPRWIKDAFRFLPVKSQFILSGNIRDIYLFPYSEQEFISFPLLAYLTESLKLVGYSRFLSFDTVDGFQVVTPYEESPDESHAFFRDTFDLKIDQAGRMRCGLSDSLDIIQNILQWRKDFVAVFNDFSSRYVIQINGMNDKEHEYFTAAFKLSLTATVHNTSGHPLSQYNPIFWICDKENDLPEWFAIDNPRIRSISLSKPDHWVRRSLVDLQAPELNGFRECTDAEKQAHLDAFVEQTNGMLLSDVKAITQLSRRESLEFKEIGEAVRRYKLGVTEDPWKRLDRRKIVNGRETIAARVMGQQQAIEKALDIIKRAVTGLSGSQGTKVGGRPRGVLFLAGPTGTGKTELAKSLTHLLFDDDQAYIRFDMSEFGAEHADQRLLGAPPGYVGYDAGGELTNAIRDKPFSVVLFDEIDKAHYRILDKFLQLLDEGVLTSGRGERVYFSEAVIIFTSNLGVDTVNQKDSFDVVTANIRKAIEEFFINKLHRPEILNRIGENIVVFHFIQPEVAAQIFNKMLKDILEGLAKNQEIIVTLEPKAERDLLTRCTRDLANGGRGIRNQLEACFVNPLARAIFDHAINEGATIKVVDTGEMQGVPSLTIESNQ